MARHGGGSGHSGGSSGGSGHGGSHGGHGGSSGGGGGSSSGYQVETSALTSMAGKLTNLGSSLEGVGAKVGGAHPGGGAFGKVGEMLTERLGSVLGQAQKHIGGVGKGAHGAGQKLHNTVADLQHNEANIAAKLKAITDPGKAPHFAGGGRGAHGGGGAGSRGPGSRGGSIGDHNTNPHQNGTPFGNRPSCGDPVDMSTGWMVLTEDDLALPGALELCCTRTHVSGYQLGRSFGASWASTWDQRLELAADGVHVAADDGTLLVYPVPTGRASVLPMSGQRRPLARTGDGGFVLHDEDGVRALLFAPRGGGEFLLSAIQNPRQRIEIDRDEAGVPVLVRRLGGQTIAVESENGLVTGLRLVTGDGEGLRLTTYRYDADARLAEVVNSSGAPLRYTYDGAGRIVRWEDRNGRWYGYEFDGRGRCVRAAGADGYMNYTFAYDAAARTTLATDSLGNTTEFAFDETLNLVRRTDPLGAVDRWEWTGAGRLAAHTDPLGRVTAHTYDDAGNRVALTFPDGTRQLAEFNALGLPVAVVEPDGTVWRREYDQDGELLADIAPDGARTAYRYDEAGNLAAVTDPAGNVTRYESNALGLPTAVTDPLGNVTRYAYDDLGRIMTVTDPLGAVESITRTEEGQPLAYTSAEGATESWLHDGEGNLTVGLDPRGGLTTYEPGPFDLPVAQVAPDGSRSVFAYDTELRVVAITNELGQVWRFRYDPAGNLVGERDFTGREVHYGYDAAGQLVSRTNAAGQVVRLDRDALGRVVRLTATEGTAPDAAAAVTEFGYDAMGRLVHARNAEAEVAIGYDALGRVVSETVNGRTVSSTYDASGRRVARRTPTGARSEWDYDRAGRPVALRTAGQTVHLGYDAAGNEIVRQVGAATLAQVWDRDHRLTVQHLENPAGDAVARRRYGYLPDGTLSTVEDRLSGPRRFDVDARGRVGAVHRGERTERYAYDPAGNLTAADDGTADLAAGQREYRDGLVVRAGGLSYSYDAEHRVVARQWTEAGGVRGWRYVWDAEDRLRETLTPQGHRWHYHYDPFGRRIAKRHLDEAGNVVALVEYCWDGDTVAEQVHDGAHCLVWDWNPVEFAALAQTDRTRVAGEPGWQDRAFHAIVGDQVGTPRELVTPDGTVAAHTDATLWGAATGAAHPLGFPGQYPDPETGVQYNYHRHYDPVIAAYLTADPLGLDAGPNARAYVANPTGWTDPLGLMGKACRTPKPKPGYHPYGRPGGKPGGRQKKPVLASTPGYQKPNMNSYQGPTQTAPNKDHSKVPAWDPTQGGFYPHGGSIQYAGPHSFTKKYSQQGQWESEHVVSSAASQQAHGKTNYKEDDEPTMSEAYTSHQPPSGGHGMGGYVSSTGGSNVASGFSGEMGHGIKPSPHTDSGWDYNGALHMGSADHMNVDPHEAHGLNSVISQHHGMGRLTDEQAMRLQSNVFNRHWNEVVQNHKWSPADSMAEPGGHFPSASQGQQLTGDFLGKQSMDDYLKGHGIDRNSYLNPQRPPRPDW